MGEQTNWAQNKEGKQKIFRVCNAHIKKNFHHTYFDDSAADDDDKDNTLPNKLKI